LNFFSAQLARRKRKSYRQRGTLTPQHWKGPIP